MRGPLDGQMALDLFPAHAAGPTWDDVQKGRARTATHGAYARPCTGECMHRAAAFESGGEMTCYLFRKPIRGGMCPSSTHLEWR